LLGNPYMPCRVNGNTTPPKVHFDCFGLIRSVPRKHGEFVVVAAAHPHSVLSIYGNTKGRLEAINGVAFPLGVITSWELNHVVGRVVGNPHISVGGCGDALKLTYVSINGGWPESFAIVEVEHSNHVVERTNPGIFF